MRILVLFVEPMLYVTDLIREVYEKTEYEFRYIFCGEKLTGRDALSLPESTVICSGTVKERAAQIKTAFDRFGPDLAVINGYVGTEQTAAIRYCRKHRIPYAIETDTPLHIPKNPLKALAKKLYLKMLLSNPLCWGFPGGTMQKENLVYYGIPEDRCFIMPMCVSADRLVAESARLPDKERLKEQFGLSGKQVFLFVGRLEPVKDLPVLLAAFEAYRKKVPDSVLMLVGDGSQMETLQQQAGDGVCFAGYQVFPDLVKYYKVADVFVLPSCYESWGLVINEAQSLDLPVAVSSRVGCGPDLVRSGFNGFVFESGDASALCDAMEQAMTLLPLKWRATDRWNHALYLQKFENAVKTICETKGKLPAMM